MKTYAEYDASTRLALGISTPAIRAATTWREPRRGAGAAGATAGREEREESCERGVEEGEVSRLCEREEGGGEATTTTAEEERKKAKQASKRRALASFLVAKKTRKKSLSNAEGSRTKCIQTAFKAEKR